VVVLLQWDRAWDRMGECSTGGRAGGWLLQADLDLHPRLHSVWEEEDHQGLALPRLRWEEEAPLRLLGVLLLQVGWDSTGRGVCRGRGVWDRDPLRAQGGGEDSSHNRLRR
jgi:hypothetical protein